MKLFPSIAVLLLTYVGMVCAEVTNHPSATVVVGHWPPWEVAVDPKKEEVTEGYAIDILKELFSRLKVQMHLRTIPWKRALSEIKSGKSDLVPMITETDERKGFMYFTSPIYTDPVLLLYSTDSFDTFEWNSWIDLKPYRLITVRGYNYGESWVSAVEKHKLAVEEVRSDNQSFKMLVSGRVDFALLYFVNGAHLMKSSPDTKKLKFAKKPIYEMDLRLGISKKSALATRLDEINLVIKDMKESGFFKKVMGDIYRE